MPAPAVIFLSYAHEDAEPARKIADALRASGLEVWFDADELRGGDQWDAKIRRQIKGCDLFLPIISATTQNRREAYFRLEWKLADDRTHMMAPGNPFVVPVVIDDTAEYEAAVPESFTKAQFTRLPHGEPTPEFLAQLKRLVTEPSATVQPPASASRSPTSTSNTAPAPHAVPAAAKRSLALPIVAMSVAAILVAMWMVSQSGRKSGNARPTPPTTAAPAVTPPAAADRLSIAVLPFANMSDDPSANSFFADGIHEDLLTNLSFVRELKVVSRTSVRQYRDTTKSVRVIARELGVGTLLEGSVRRSGDQVRVTAQLIDASTDEHIWAQNYDRKLEDIFAIQGELAKAITQALRVALTAEQADNFAQRPTENIEAYELFLKEQELSDREGNNEERVRKSIAMMQRAVELDPNFALAWANLGTLHAQAHFWKWDQSESRRDQATTAIERAIKLGPDNLDVMTYVGSYFYYGFRNYTKAAEFYQKVLSEAPNHIEALASMGYIRRREGKWAESIRYHERVIELDPRNIGVATGLTTTYSMLRQWDKAAAMQQILVDQAVGDIQREALLVFFQANRDNALLPYQRFLARYPDLQDSDIPVFRSERVRKAIVARDWETAVVELQSNLKPDDVGNQFMLALVYRIMDEPEKMRETLEHWLNLEAPEHDDTGGFRRACAWALLGEVEEANRETARFILELNERNDAMEKNNGPATAVLVAVWTASPSKAIGLMRDYLRLPANQIFSRHDLQSNVWLYPLWGHPEFEALAQDDDAWAPLIVD